MINRVLIRIKVVQLLYSTLLTENSFTLESFPSAPTKEKRFAYNLYLNTLLLFEKIAENLSKNSSAKRKLSDSRFIVRLSKEKELTAFEKINPDSEDTLRGLIAPLSEKIKDSLLYKEYVRSDSNDVTKEKIWEDLYKVIISTDNDFRRVVSKFTNYSPGGVERMQEMLENTFKKFYTTRDNISDAINLLEKSMNKARELYMRLLLLPVELTRLRELQIDENRHKYLLSDEDINPNLKFVENSLVKKLENCRELEEYVDRNKLSWLVEDRNLMELLLKEIMDSEEYKHYMDSPGRNENEDGELWRNLFKNVILQSEYFLDALESKSVFWNDDLEIMSTFALKSMRKISDGEDPEESILPMYKDEEDAEFGKKLFTDVLYNKDLYRGYLLDAIEKDKWESDRLAFMDVVIIITAIAEILKFPKIPLLVTLNEYIEIAKSYSSQKSGGFVNGLLREIVARLREKGLCLK